MRRSIVFALILALPLGLMGWAHSGMTQAQDDVDITPILTIGDSAAMEGHSVTMESWCGEHMKWLTDFLPGEEPRTEYTFVQNQEYENEWDNRFGLYAPGGTGMSTSGGFQLGDQGMGKLVQAVADQTQPGQTFTTTVLIEDYMDYYELSYEAYIRTDSLWIDEQFHGYLEQDNWFIECQDVYEEWAKRFRFPVIPGHQMEVSVTKDEAGNITSIHYDYASGGLGAEITGWATEEGVYLAPYYMDLNYQPLGTGQFPEGNGIYFIPYKAAEGNARHGSGTYRQGTFDFEGLRLVYPLEPEDRIITMEPEEESGLLHMILEEDGRLIYTRMDLETMEFEERLDIGTEYSSDFQLFQEQGLYLLNGESTITLVDIRGEPKVEFTVPLLEGMDARTYEDLVYEDGKLYLTAQDWNDSGRKLVLLMCDREGIHFYGEYCWDEWASQDYVYGMKPELVDVWFTK